MLRSVRSMILASLVLAARALALPDMVIPPVTIDDSGRLQRGIRDVHLDIRTPPPCAIEETCVGGPGVRKLLKFGVAIANVGTSDLRRGDLTNPDAFEFSPCHGHYHLKEFAAYQLRRRDGTVMALGHKQSFCLLDSEKMPGTTRPRQFNDCHDVNAQGISAGWADVYYAGLDCQWVDVTDVPPGDYDLVVLVNAANPPLFEESDRSNNHGRLSVTLTDSAAIVLDTADTARVGGSVSVTWSGIPNATANDWIGLFRRGTAGTSWLAWLYTNGTKSPTVPVPSGTATLPVPAGAAPGEYEVRLYRNGSASNLIATGNPISMVYGVSLTARAETAAPGGTVPVSWSGIPAPSTNDWIGLFRRSGTDSEWLSWIYVSGTKTPGAAMAAGSTAMPLLSTVVPGRYDLRLFRNGSSARLATSNAFAIGVPTAASPSHQLLSTSDVTYRAAAFWAGIPSPTRADWIGLYRPGMDSRRYIDYMYVNGLRYPTEPLATGQQFMTVPPDLTETSYEFRLFSNGGFSQLGGTDPFLLRSLIATAAVPGFAPADPAQVVADDSVLASWNGATGASPADRLALYRTGATGDPLDWVYLSGSKTPGSAAASGRTTVTLPPALLPGSYELRWLPDGSTSARFTSNPFSLMLPRTDVVSNGGFEQGRTVWTGDTVTIGTFSQGRPYAGTRYCWLVGYGRTITERISQTVTIPPMTTVARLSLRLMVASDEAPGGQPADTFTCEVRNASGTVLETLTASNADAGPDYVLRTLDLSPYQGQTVVIELRGTEDAARATSFFVDEVGLVCR
jgi:phage terminase large subunit-like protein